MVQLATSRKIFPDGKILMEKAIEIAASRLGMGEGFKASNGWLARQKQCYNIVHRTVSGESGDVNDETVESWLERLPFIVTGYEAQDIWNCDETGLFWKVLPDSGLAEKGKACGGGKRSKMRVTILFFVNGRGLSSAPLYLYGNQTPPNASKA